MILVLRNPIRTINKSINQKDSVHRLEAKTTSAKSRVNSRLQLSFRFHFIYNTVVSSFQFDVLNPNTIALCIILLLVVAERKQNYSRTLIMRVETILILTHYTAVANTQNDSHFINYANCDKNKSKVTINQTKS